MQRGEGGSERGSTAGVLSLHPSNSAALQLCSSAAASPRATKRTMHVTPSGVGWSSQPACTPPASAAWQAPHEARQ